MEPQSQDDKLIARYLLGELSEDEQTQVEERAFSDKDYFLHVRAVEKDLIDEYARGELPGPGRLSFERRFLASEHRRRQIEFARAFTQVAAEGPEVARSVTATSGSWWQSCSRFWRGSNLAFRFSLAGVALIIIISGVWLLLGTSQSRSEQARTQPTPQTTPQSQQSAAPLPVIDQNAQKVASPAPPPGKEASPAPPQQPVIASLLLLPGTSRGQETLPQLTIHPATAGAQLRIGIDKEEPYTQFRAELHTTAGKFIARQNLKAQSSRDGRIIVWLIPAGQLNSGEYELSLSGTSKQGQTEAVGYYYFKVLKK